MAGGNCGVAALDSADDYPQLGGGGGGAPQTVGVLTPARAAHRALPNEGSACPYCEEECGDWTGVLHHLDAAGCAEAAELSELSGSWKARMQQKKDLAKRCEHEAQPPPHSAGELRHSHSLAAAAAPAGSQQPLPAVSRQAIC